MLALDAAVIHFLNQFANRSCLFDLGARYFQGTPLLKGVVVLAVVWGLLFTTDGPRAEKRDQLLAVFLLAIVALFVARGLAVVLPFRDRPLHDPALHFQLTCGFPPEALDGWSSFPSDHAVMYCMLAAGIGFVSRRLGWATMAYVVVLILFPRVYLGLHWPSDVLAGAALGIGCAHLARRATAWVPVGRWAGALRARYPGSLHAGMFLWSYLLATHFDEIRRAARHLASFVRAGTP